MTKCICVILYIVMVVLSDVGERVRLVRKLLNLTQKEFADRLGLSRSLIAEIEAGRRQPKERTLRLIAYTFRISFTWLKEGKGEIFVKHDEVEEVELIKLPVISAVGAGGAMYTSDYELVVRSSIPHDRLKAFRVKGDSMEPTIQDGWLVVIDEEDKELQDGRIYLIAEQNNGLRIRRLRKVDGVWWLFPDNPEYPLERLTPDLWIVGRVLYKIKPAIVEVAK